jgi:hypothetical protein
MDVAVPLGRLDALTPLRSAEFHDHRVDAIPVELCKRRPILRRVMTVGQESRRAFFLISVAPSANAASFPAPPKSPLGERGFDTLDRPFDRAPRKKTLHQLSGGGAFRRGELFPPQSCAPIPTRPAREETTVLPPTSLPIAEASLATHSLTHAGESRSRIRPGLSRQFLDELAPLEWLQRDLISRRMRLNS